MIAYYLFTDITLLFRVNAPIKIETKYFELIYLRAEITTTSLTITRIRNHGSQSLDQSTSRRCETSN